MSNTETQKAIEANQALVKKLQEQGAREVMAQKSGCLIVRPAIEGEIISVHTERQDGKTEADEVGIAGMYVTQAVDLDRNPVLNSNGEPNIWQQSIENLQKKYDMEHIEPDGFVKPKGGIQKFLQVPKDVEVQVPWGKNGEMIPLRVEKGGYLNITNQNDIYGVGEKEFGELYKVEQTPRDTRDCNSINELFAFVKQHTEPAKKDTAPSMQQHRAERPNGHGEDGPG